MGKHPCCRMICGVLLAVMLNGCSGERFAPGDIWSSSGGAKPQGGIYKIGDPYEIGGQWYYPAADPTYDETGIASWYGRKFHGRKTANGEIFDMNLLSAAHKTLPLPVNVKVTNLENGRSIVVRVNDRGPFVNDRIIDLSRKAAEVLAMKGQGTAYVRVQYVGIATLNGRGPVEQAVAVPVGSVETAPLSEPSVVAINTGSYIQAGAFSNYDSALKMQSRLRSLGEVRLNPVEIDGETLYRVQIGPFKNDAAASSVLSETHNLGIDAARIVQH